MFNKLTFSLKVNKDGLSEDFQRGEHVIMNNAWHLQNFFTFFLKLGNVSFHEYACTFVS